MGSLRANAVRVEITPDQDISLAGEVGWFRPGKYVDSPLYARALVLASGPTKLCFISLDVTIITAAVSARIRAAIARDQGIPPGAVMVHATQVHAAPALGVYMFDRDFPPVPAELEWLAGGVRAYEDYAVDRILASVREAAAGLQPARLRAGSGIEGRIQFNRRAITDDGTARMPGPSWPQPLGPTYIRYLEGPTDPEVGILCVQSLSARPIALVLHHTGHPVNVFPQAVISADWPGAWAEEVERRFPCCVALVANGCCGNINPWNPFDPDYRPDHRRMGRMLAEVTRCVLDHSDLDESNELGVVGTRLPIPIRAVDTEALRKAQQVLVENPTPVWNESKAYRGYEGGSPVPPGTKVVDSEWIQAASIVSVDLQRRRERNLDYEIQVMRLGSSALVGLAGEPFVEGQLQIKMASPAATTLVAHCCNMYCGYLPIPDAFQRGGHEVDTRYWTKLVPEALGMVVEETGRLLEKVFARRSDTSQQ